MLEHFIRDTPQNMNALINILKKKIGQAKRGKEQIKYLLVLDDVWNAEKWDELKNHLMGINKNGGNGVIVTTRIQNLIAKEIAKQCRGVPLKNTCWNILTFKIHDSVHDLSLSVSKFDTLLFQENFSLTLIECSHIRQLILDVIVTPKLYLLFLEIDVSKELSKSFTRLKFLKFVCATNICELLDSLGELKHLRKELQPVNIGNLTCLQVLPVFFVGSLKELRGELKICDLGGVRDKQEPNGAILHLKKQYAMGVVVITKVKCMGNEFYCNEGIDAMVATETFMFPCLEELDICDCPFLKNVPLTGQCSSIKKPHISKCKTLSKIRDGLSTSIYLKELDIKDCPNLSWIPDLEGFSSLQNLSIDSYKELEVLPITGGCSSLEKLIILGCESLSKIEDELFSSTYLEECFSLKILSINSCKELKLNIFGCEKLNKIGDGLFTPSLQNLSIDSCNELELSIFGCEKLSKIGDGLSTCACLKELDLEGFSSLQNLSINSYNELEVLPITRRCSSLEKLRISSCKNISKIGGRLSTSTYLKELDLYLCSNLSRIPDFEGFSFLQNLSIDSCKELAKLQEFPCLSSFQYLSASLRVLELTELTILEFQGIKAFLEWLGNLSSLRYLYLKSFKNLSSLCCLRIWSCNKLMYLPSVDVMGSFSKLETIDDFMCHQLETRCEKESGPEWSKISHIPHICTNYRMV
ncbi:hypothetical protein ES288_D09G005700v1 [Gossypium darwinii]|uniref:NB-ARC domain-containing protein n=1 Tax=Gossypium darwinii TaxID=34276 RepID=A0A5D2B6L8_GOSDA|nr:hypothetical protein ES288_D09G005700v1 [Gossypium darwinii]